MLVTSICICAKNKPTQIMRQIKSKLEAELQSL